VRKECRWCQLGGGLRDAGQSERNNEGKNNYPFEESNLDILTCIQVALVTELFLKTYLLKLQKILFLYRQCGERFISY